MADIANTLLQHPFAVQLFPTRVEVDAVEVA
jgi:hypothetical protein